MTSTTANTNVAAPRLERPRDGRMVAGVAAGLARHLNIDPILVRLAFAVAVVAGGFGVLAYIAGVLLIPEEGSEKAIVHGANSSRTGTIAGITLLVIGGLMAMDAVFDGHFFGHIFWTVAFLAAGAWLLLREPRDTGAVPPAATPPAPDEPTSGDTAETRVMPPAPPPEPPEPRRRGGTRVVAGVMLIGAGVVSAIYAATGADVAWQEVAGIAVIAAGATLVAGAFFDASPWLMVPPLIFAACVAGLGAAGAALDGPIGDREYRPVLAAELPAEYRHAIGEVDVDLTDVRFPAGTTELKVHLGIGDALVRVPDDVAVRVDAHAGAGEVNVFGERSDGTDVDRSETIAMPGKPTLVLDAEVGFGELTVVRGQ